LFQKWLHLAGKPNHGVKVECPSCGQTAVDFQYVADPASRIGYLDIWCGACFKGIHISRARVPEGMSMLDIKSPPDLIAARIPHFIWVLPDE
jgi:hypothetical protein